MKYFPLILLSIVLCLTACSGSKQKSHSDQIVSATHAEYKIEYAKGFSVEYYKDYKKVTVVDPWDTTKILQEYILVDKLIELPNNLPKGVVVRTPLANIVAYSTIHCATLNEIGVINTVTGVCEPEYIDIQKIKEGIKDGSISNVGLASNPIVEKIIELEPEAIWSSPIQGLAYGSISRAGIPIIETPDYMEATALGRAEWIRFYSLFFNNEQYVDSLFNVTATNYNAIRLKTALASTLPTVFLDQMYRNVWYTPGGESFMSKMLSDAGAIYAWHNDGKIVSTPLSFEQVLDKAENVDIWLIKYNREEKLTYKGLEKEYKLYSYFDAFKNRNIYECNTQHRNYYEDLPIHPDYILQDLAYIFHPHLFPDYTPRYYSKMSE